MEEFALSSHTKAARAIKEGKFKKEIVSIKGLDKNGNAVIHDTDEGVRPNTTLEKLAKLPSIKQMQVGGADKCIVPPAPSPLSSHPRRNFSTQSKGKRSGRITAGLSSQICDGAAAILICNEAGLKKLGLRPRAKIVALALAGADPVVMLSGPIPATKNALERSGLSMSQMDVYEVNEAFAPVPLAWAKALGADLNKLNVNGGAMALGHPLGGTGCKLMTTLVHELERRGGRYGLQAICEGGGTGEQRVREERGGRE